MTEATRPGREGDPGDDRRRAPRTRLLMRFVRNPLALIGAVLISVLVLSAMFAPWVAPYPPLEMNLMEPYLPPGSPGHLLGTDNFGRDILSRIIHGSRISLFIGIVVVSIASVIGTALGLLAGFYGGWVDSVIMRLVEIFYSFPFLILVIAVIALFGPSILNVMLVLGFVSWPLYARIVRGQVLTLREVEYVEAARASGVGGFRIMARHILPNTLTPVIVMATFGIPEAILASAALGFLGLGVQPPTPEWGVMVSEGKDFIRRAPYLILWPGIAVMIAVLSFNFVGDGLRDVLDPKRVDA